MSEHDRASASTPGTASGSDGMTAYHWLTSELMILRLLIANRFACSATGLLFIGVKRPFEVDFNISYIQK